jgi:hypothetical protein
MKARAGSNAATGFFLPWPQKTSAIITNHYRNHRGKQIETTAPAVEMDDLHVARRMHPYDGQSAIRRVVQVPHPPSITQEFIMRIVARSLAAITLVSTIAYSVNA